MYAKTWSSPTIFGYVRMPPIWVAEGVLPGERRPMDPNIARETTLKRTVGPEINARVRRDGIFLFDVSQWSRADTLHAMTEYEFFRDQALKEKADLHAARRAQLLNAHQACLSTAESEIGHRQGEIGHPVDAQDAITLDSLDREPTSSVDNVGSSLAPRIAPFRFAFDVATVNASFDILASLLKVTEVDLVALVALLHLATFRYSRRGFDEANFLSWAICEQLLRSTWRKHAKSNSSSSKIGVISKNLFREGLLSPSLSSELETALRSRNDWAHKLSSRQPSDALASLLAAEKLIAHLFGVRIRLPHNYAGGAVWIRDRLPAGAQG